MSGSEKEKKPLRAPHNTALEAIESPIVPLVEAMLANSPGDAIIAQEAAGQRSLVESDTLPTEIHGGGKKQLEAAGVKFLGAVESDNLFQYVQLPNGWEKVPTDQDMWSNLVDETGRIRANIFYKAAFYDRRAYLQMC